MLSVHNFRQIAPLTRIKIQKSARLVSASQDSETLHGWWVQVEIEIGSSVSGKEEIVNPGKFPQYGIIAFMENLELGKLVFVVAP